MPVFRLRTTTGQTRTITAGRVLVADGEVRFQSPSTSGLTTVASAPLATVERVERRFNEADGRLRWSDEQAVNAAAAQARPAAAQPTSPPAEDPPPPPDAGPAAVRRCGGSRRSRPAHAGSTAGGERP